MTWKSVPFAPKYFVSEAGEVAKKINADHPERRQWLVMKQDIDKDGYAKVSILGRNYFVHRVVYATFHGELVKNKVVCHLDGNNKNNHANNLDQLTQKQNISHKLLHGTWQSGEKHPRAKLSNDQANQIAGKIMQAEKNKVGGLRKGEARRIADEAHVHVGLVHAISRTRRSYKNELHIGL